MGKPPKNKWLVGGRIYPYDNLEADPTEVVNLSTATKVKPDDVSFVQLGKLAVGKMVQPIARIIPGMNVSSNGSSSPSQSRTKPRQVTARTKQQAKRRVTQAKNQAKRKVTSTKRTAAARKTRSTRSSAKRRASSRS